MRRTVRGQAVVELAVTLALFVPVIIAGLWFAEVAWLGLKAHEIANYSAFELTRRPVAYVGADTTSTIRTSSVIAETEDDTRRRYADLNGDTPSGGTGLVQHVFARSELDVDCVNTFGSNTGPPLFEPPSAVDPNRDIAYRTHHAVHNFMLGFSFPYSTLVAQMDRIYPSGFNGFTDLTGAACRTKLTVRPPLPLLGASLNMFKVFNRNLVLCSPGVAEGGECKGHYAQLLGDYGLDNHPRNQQGASDCRRADGCLNRGYLEMISQVHKAHLLNDFQINNDWADVSIPNGGGGWMQIFDTTNTVVPDTQNFDVLSFAGVEHDYMDYASFSGEKSEEYNTAGVFAGTNIRVEGEEFTSTPVIPARHGWIDPGKRRNPSGWWLGQDPNATLYRKYNK